MDERIIRAKLDQIHRRATAQRWPIGPWQARTADHLAPGQYRYDGDWSYIAGASEWPAGKTLFLRAEVETPVGSELISTLHLQFDAQWLAGLLSIDGRPYAGIDANHPRVTAPSAGRLMLEAEFMCARRADW